MFIPDGSDIDYHSEKSLKGRYSWGWLGDFVPQSGWNDLQQKRAVISRLRSFKATMHHMGVHDCKICVEEQGGEPQVRYAARTYREWLKRQEDPKPPKVEIFTFNGSYLIDFEGKRLRCPAGVEHYIEEHDYNPGSFVIDAILHGKEVVDAVL